MEYSLMEVKAKKSSNRANVISFTILGLTIAALVIVVLALSITLGVERNNSKQANSNPETMNNDTASDICLTVECVELSSQISRSLDPSVDPCQNFYQFACNRFIQENIIPAGKGNINGFSELAEFNGERIRVILESNNGRGLDSLNKAITYYDSCLDIELMDSRSEDDLMEVLQNLGGWPLVGIESSTTWSINDESFLMEKLYGSNAFFSSIVQADPRDTSRNVYCISQAGLTITGPTAYVDENIRFFMASAMAAVFNSINSSISMATYKEAATEILELETQIASVFDFTLFVTQYFEVYDVTDYRNLSEIVPEFDWINNLNFYGREANFSIRPSDDVCLLIRPNMLQTLNRLIANTDTRILQNYAKWHFVLSVLGDLSGPFREINDVIERVRTGNTNDIPRDAFCMSAVQENFRYPVARAFFDSYVNPRIMETVSEIAEEIREAMIERITSIDWLDDATRQRALNKVRLIVSFQVVPKEIFNDNFLDSLYSNYVVEETSGYFINAINTIRANKLFELSFLGKMNTRSNWYLVVAPPTKVNAFYYFLLNHFYILEGILNAPFFKEYWPNFFKYGTLGFVIGHEITHGFDTNGQRFDEYGNFANWWTESSQAEFDKRAKCFVEQYSKYRVEAGQVNGNLTLGENIADNGGLAISYLAYKNLQKDTKPEKKLPGLPYTPDQLFFIGTAQPFCIVTTQSAQSSLLTSDNHSPSSIRPIGVVSNSPEFAKAFNCPAGSPMNPTKKCRLW